MADTATRLAGPTQLGTGAATVYTVPGATTAIIRSLLVCNTTANQVKFTVSIGADAAGTRVFFERAIAPRETFEYHGFIVLTAAGTLQAYADTASAATLTVSGVQVT